MMHLRWMKAGVVVFATFFISAGSAVGQGRAGEGPRSQERGFNAWDTNADGQINRDEFLDHQPKMLKRMQERGKPPYNRESPPDESGFDGKWGGQSGGRMREQVERRFRERIERLVHEIVEQQVSEMIENKMHEILEQRRGPRGFRDRSADTAPGQRGGKSMRRGGADKCDELPMFRGQGRWRDQSSTGPRGTTHGFRRPRAESRGSWGPGRQDQPPGSGKHRMQQLDRLLKRPGGPASFRTLDRDKDGMLQSTELQQAIDTLQKLLEDSAGREIPLNKWGRAIGERDPRQTQAPRGHRRMNRPDREAEKMGEEED